MSQGRSVSVLFQTDEQLAARLRKVEAELRRLDLVALASEVRQVADILEPETDTDDLARR